MELELGFNPIPPTEMGNRKMSDAMNEAMTQIARGAYYMMAENKRAATKNTRNCLPRVREEKENPIHESEKYLGHFL